MHSAPCSVCPPPDQPGGESGYGIGNEYGVPGNQKGTGPRYPASLLHAPRVAGWGQNGWPTTRNG
jgi:hypothetical protein